MLVETVAEGFVDQRIRAVESTNMIVGSRTATASSGEVVCSAMHTSGLGINDFVPTLYRSLDGGLTWKEQGPAWPHLIGQWSIFASISRDVGGDLCLFGSRTPIAVQGEPFWSDATQGLKQNELIRAHSTDGGRTWTDPIVIPMLIPGAAEAPGGLCSTRGGCWLAPYSPYNTFDPVLKVDRNQVVVLRSHNRGDSWQHVSMLRFDEVDSGGAEAWVVELSDGLLLATAWHISFAGVEFPNAYSISHDQGVTWRPTRSTGILGQSTSLAPLPDGRALFVYNQRKHGKPGVWLAVVRPTGDYFGIESNQIIWEAATSTQSGTSGDHSGWSDFSFGEPSIEVLPDGTWLVTLWCAQPTACGIRYLKLKPT